MIVTIVVGVVLAVGAVLAMRQLAKRDNREDL